MPCVVCPYHQFKNISIACKRNSMVLVGSPHNPFSHPLAITHLFPVSVGLFILGILYKKLLKQVQWHMRLIIHLLCQHLMDAILSSGCSRFQFHVHGLGKAAEDASRPWAFAPMWVTWKEHLNPSFRLV